MLSILAITAPIFIIIGVGYLLTKQKLMPSELLPVLSKMVLFVLIPALNFGTVANMKIEDVLVWDFLGTYALAAILAQIVALILFKGLLKDSLSSTGMKMLGAAMPNSIFIGYPVVIEAFGPEWGHTFAFCVLVETMVILPIALIVAESGGSGGSTSFISILKGIVERVSKNPVIISFVAGLLVSGLSIPLPGFFSRTLSVLGSAAPAVALLIIGGSLVGTRLKGDLRDCSFVAAIKLAIHPLCAALVLMFWPDFDPTLEALVVLYAALPSAAVFAIIGSQYGMRSFCSSSLALTTVSSFFTLTVVLALILN
ncbi:MAG: AEC family transporter [Oceanobacter sp.]